MAENDRKTAPPANSAAPQQISQAEMDSVLLAIPALVGNDKTREQLFKYLENPSEFMSSQGTPDQLRRQGIYLQRTVETLFALGANYDGRGPINTAENAQALVLGFQKTFNKNILPQLHEQTIPRLQENGQRTPATILAMKETYDWCQARTKNPGATLHLSPVYLTAAKMEVPAAASSQLAAAKPPQATASPIATPPQLRTAVSAAPSKTVPIAAPAAQARPAPKLPEKSVVKSNMPAHTVPGKAHRHDYTSIHFRIGSAHLSDQDKSQLARMAKDFEEALAQGRAHEIDITGYADKVGSPTTNQHVSEQRAEAVATELKTVLQKDGVELAKVTINVKAVGSKGASPANKGHNRKDRRVSIFTPTSS